MPAGTMAGSPGRSRALFLTLLLFAPSACSRKAPGPHECYHFALRVMGVQSPRELSSPRVKSTVDQLTNRCLTTPFDRQLLSCVEQVGDVQRCFAAFQARHATPQLSDDSRP